ncbi:MAG: hypothetical protein QXW70_01890 [Candidatus Anstonellales archaeon]
MKNIKRDKRRRTAKIRGRVRAVSKKFKSNGRGVSVKRVGGLKVVRNKTKKGLKKASTKKLQKSLVYRKRMELLSTALSRQKMIELGGEEAIKVISAFSKDMSDEELAKRAEVRICDVRTVLNRLHAVGLVSYVRNRDQSSGWYTYIWRINDDLFERFSNYMNIGGGEGGEQTQNFEGEYYCCRRCGTGSLINFDDAFSKKFICSCGAPLEYFKRDRDNL